LLRAGVEWQPQGTTPKTIAITSTALTITNDDGTVFRRMYAPSELCHR